MSGVEIGIGAGGGSLMLLGATDDGKRLVSIIKNGNKMLELDDGGKAAKKALIAANAKDPGIKLSDSVKVSDATIDASIKGNKVTPFKGVTLKSAGGSIGMVAAFSGILALGISKGEIDKKELAIMMGGAGFAETVEQGIKKGIEKAGTKVANKTLTKAGSRAGGKIISSGAKVGVQGAAKISAAAAKASTGIGIVLLAFDGINMVLDLVDPCGYNKKELFQKDLNEVHKQYLDAYKEAFNEIGMKYPGEFKPDYINDKTQVEQNLLFLEYLDKCNLELPSEDDLKNKLKKRRLRQRRLILNTVTGTISPAVYAEFGDDNYRAEPNALLFALVLRKARQKQILNTAKRAAAITKYMFYIAVFILLMALWIYIIFY